MVVLRNSEDAGQRTVWIELSEHVEDAEPAVAAFAQLVEALPADLRRLWDACADRCLNVGIQGGPLPHETAFSLSPRAIAAMTAISVRFQLTVYGWDS